MALYREGKAAMAEDGTVTGTGTKWQSSLSLIRPGATIIFLSSPIQMAVVNKVVSDTEIKAITTKGAVVASTDYAILLSDSLTVDGLAQDVAETLRYYQSQETVIADAVEFFKNFDFDSLQDLANQIKQDSESAGASATAAAASENAAKTSEANSKASEVAAETARDQVQQIINDAGEQSTLVALAQTNGASKVNGLGFVTPEMFFINGESSDDWRPAIQRMMDAIADGSAGTRYAIFGGDYPVSLNPSSPGVTNAYAAGSVAISIKSPVNISGGGRVFLKSGQGSGKEGAIFGNPNVTTLTDVTFDTIEIDGNSANTSGKISGILMVGMTRLTINPGTYIHDCTNHGAMARPNASQSNGYGPVDVTYNSPRVERVGGIGLQATRPDGLIINGCNVKDTADNAIDVYGNDGSGGASNGYARRISINNPQVTGSKGSGMFMESYTDSTITGDYYDCNGPRLNRINSGAKRAKVSVKVSCYTYASAGLKYGVGIQNSSGQILIEGCEFDSLKQSVLCGTGTVGMVVSNNNIHRDIRQYIIQHSYNSNSLVQSSIADQLYDGVLSANGWPQMAPPIDHPWYLTSRYQSVVGDLYLLTANTKVKPNFSKSYSGVLGSPSGWSGKYSIYNFGSDGKTRIAPSVSIDVTNYPIVVIDGSPYELSATGTAGQYFAALWDGVKGTHGDYSSSLNSALTIDLKYDGFKTPLYSDTTYTATYTMAAVTDWSGYSTYLGLDTIIYIPGATIAAETVAVINSYAYRLTPTSTIGQYIAKRVNKSSSDSGDWTLSLASNHTVYVQ